MDDEDEDDYADDYTFESDDDQNKDLEIKVRTGNMSSNCISIFYIGFSLVVFSFNFYIHVQFLYNRLS